MSFKVVYVTTLCVWKCVCLSERLHVTQRKFPKLELELPEIVLCKEFWELYGDTLRLDPNFHQLDEARLSIFCCCQKYSEYVSRGWRVVGGMLHTTDIVWSGVSGLELVHEMSNNIHVKEDGSLFGL